MTLDKGQRAARAWTSQGVAAVMLQDMSEAEIGHLAELVTEDGKQVEGFREKFLTFYNEYYDARKASAAAPPALVQNDSVEKELTISENAMTLGTPEDQEENQPQSEAEDVT